MKKVAKWLDRKAGAVWFSCFFNLAVLAGMMLLLRSTFETNDDISISMIVNGAWGVHDPHVICQNYLLGLLYSLFYRIGHGRIPWYAIIQFAAIFAALTTVTWVWFQKLQRAQAWLVNGILLIYFGYECYIRMQYTKTAGIMMAAGALLLFYEVEKEKASVRGMIWGIILAVAGSLYRFEEAAICCVLMAGIGLYFLMTRKKLITLIAVFGLTGLLMVGTEVFDHQIYASDPKWNTYMKYNDLRSNLTDYSMAPYKGNEEAYQELGIDKTAYRIFKNGLNFYDPDIFPLETVEKIEQLRPRNRLSKLLVMNFFKEFPIGYLKIPTFYGFLLLAFLWLFWRQKGWKVWVIAGYEICAMGAIDFYLYYAGRYLENRVETGLWFAITLVVIWFYDRRKTGITEKYALIALGGLLLAGQSTWKECWRALTVQKEVDRDYLRDSFMEAVETDPEGLYLAKVGTITYTGYGILDAVPEGRFENVVWYGGWEMGNPLWQNKMAEYGIVNPYRDLTDKEHVYLVDNKIDLTVKYIQKHYQKNVEAELVKEAGYLQVYQIKSKEME